MQRHKTPAAPAPAPAPTHRPLVARDLCDISHPLYPTFAAWCKSREVVLLAGPSAPSARKARKFLSVYPQYRKVMVEIRPAA
jgi:hypothetical protein